MTITTLTIVSDDISPVLISGMGVRVFTTSGSFVTSGTSNGSGQVVFDLPDADYDLYFFKMGVSPNLGQPERITVSVGDLHVPPNSFKIIAHITSAPESTDPTLCTISGSIRGADGSFTGDIRMAMGMKPHAGVVSGVVIAPNDIIDVLPDSNGYYEFNLLRKREYRVYFPQLIELFEQDPPELHCLVPDLPALKLTDFLFPVPISATFAQTTLSMHIGDPTAVVNATITYSDGSVNQDGIRPSPPFFVSVGVTSDNDAVASVSMIADQVFVVANGVGTANITVTRTVNTNMMVYDPVPSFTTPTLVVTVS